MTTKIEYMGKKIKIIQKHDDMNIRMYLVASSIESFEVDGVVADSIDEKIALLSQLPHHIFDKLENNMCELERENTRMERFKNNVRISEL